MAPLELTDSGEVTMTRNFKLTSTGAGLTILVSIIMGIYHYGESQAKSEQRIAVIEEKVAKVVKVSTVNSVVVRDNQQEMRHLNEKMEDVKAGQVRMADLMNKILLEVKAD